MKRRKGYDSGGYVKDPSQGYIGVDASRGGGQSQNISGSMMGGVSTGLGFGNMLMGPKGGGKAKGGPIKKTAGPRIGKDDGLIPAQKGEYVVRRSAVNKLGTKALDTINKGKLPKRAR